jgi:hypothetical protein
MFSLMIIGCLNSKELFDTASSEATSLLQCGEFAREPILLAESESSTQIHPDILFDTDRWYMVYNLPNENSKFEVWMKSFDCTGELLWGPELISIDEDVNHTVPRLALNNGRLLVMWQSDDGSGNQNLSIRYRFFDTEESALSERLLWSPYADGFTEIQNAWMPTVSSFNDGFWVGGAVAYDGYFSIVAQPWDSDGDVLEDPKVISPLQEQAYFPSIEAIDSTQFYIGYEHIDGDQSVILGMWNGENLEVTAEVDNAAAPMVKSWDGSAVGVSHYNPSSPTVYWGTEPLGTPSMTHSPSVIIGDTGALVSHYKIISGFQNELHWSFVNSNGEVQSTEMIISDPPAAPYRTALSHVTSDHYFVVWTGGESPDFMLHGMLVQP